MKVLITLCVIGLVAVSIGQNLGPRGEEWQKMIDDCKTKSNATDDEVHNIMRMHTASTRSEQCMMACIQKTTGVMKADNTIDPDEAMKKFDRVKQHNPEMWAKIKTVIDTCLTKATAETDECVAAKKFADCDQTEREKAGIKHH